MGKRTAFDYDAEGRESKRRKSSKYQQVGENGLVDITSYLHLNKLLTFHQNEASYKRRSKLRSLMV